MRKFYFFLFAMTVCLCSLGAHAVRTATFDVAPGSEAVVMSYSAGDYVFYQSLKEGENTVEIQNYAYLYLFPAPGLETISVEPEDACVYRSGADIQQYTIYGGSTLNGKRYEVTTSGGQAGKPTAIIRLAPGAQAQVLELNERTYEYTLHADLHEGENTVEFEMESTAVPGTVPFYYLCGKEGQILDAVTDVSGNPVDLRENSAIGTYVELTAFTYLPEYNVTTKDKPEPVGDPVFILSEGSRAYWQPFGGGNKQTLLPGDNYATIDESDVIDVYPADGHHFTSFTNAYGENQTISSSGSVRITGAYNFKPPYYITTMENEGPDPVFTIEIDDPDAVECTFVPSYKTIPLKSGVNSVSFNRYGETTIQISTVGMSYVPFYSVTVDGEEQPSSYQHFIDVEDGMEIVALVNYPADEKFTYTLEYVGNSEGFWTGIEVDGETVETNDNQFQAPAGSKIGLYNTDADNWKITEIILPDGSRHTAIPMPWTPITFYASGNGTVKVDARPAVQIGVTVNIVAGADKIKVINGNFNTGSEITGLVNGVNEITIKDNVDYIIVRHTGEEDTVKSVTFKASPDSDVVPADYDPYFHYYTAAGLRDGAEITVVAGNGDTSSGLLFEEASGEGLLFDLAGRRVKSANPEAGIYLHVQPDGKTKRIMVK